LLPVADIDPAFKDVKALVQDDSPSKTLLVQLCRVSDSVLRLISFILSDTMMFLTMFFVCQCIHSLANALHNYILPVK